MPAILLFILTALAYIAMAFMNIQKTTARGEYLMGSGLILFGLLAVYVITSLLLTISVASRGGFDWLSPSSSTRKVFTGLLWLGMVAGVVFCAMLSTEYTTDRTTGILRTLSMPVYFGSMWLPLLMLIPYAILLNPSWRESLSPVLYKFPLVLACVLGVVILMIPKIVSSANIQVPKQSDAEWKKENLTASIQNETSLETLLQYIKDDDEWVRKMASEKIKKDPHYEDHLIKTLSRNDGYGHYGFYQVYMFMDQNQVDHPDRFVESVNNTISAISTEVQRILGQSSRYPNDLSILNIDLLCRVLDKQFSSHSAVFRPNMLKLQEALNTPPAPAEQEYQDFIDLHNTYKAAVKTWLETHG